MNVKTFIDRPIFAGVISVMILLVGLIGLTQLPVEQFPEIAPLPSVFPQPMPEPMQRQCRRVCSYLWRRQSTV